MASEDRDPIADPAMTLDEVAPRRRAQRVPSRTAARRRRSMAVTASIVVVLVALGATVAAVAGPTPDRDIGQGVAQVASSASPTTVLGAPTPTTVAPTTTVAPAPEAADNADIAPTDCANDDMCGEIIPDGTCDDEAMCGEIRADDDCADGEMCGDIPAPAECTDPAMCGQIVPQPVDP